MTLTCSHFLSHPPKMLLPVLFLYLVTISAGEGTTQQKLPPLLLVSFDGFRADYLRRFHMPNLELLYSQGVLVEELTNAFITKTFPNHYTLVGSPYQCSLCLDPGCTGQINRMTFLFFFVFFLSR